ncbi:MAG: hypothetical protein POH28_01075, partial [Acidocella sp.]|nr:hypothetical protein [Acidocella sp.]
MTGIDVRRDHWREQIRVGGAISRPSRIYQNISLLPDTIKAVTEQMQSPNPGRCPNIPRCDDIIRVFARLKPFRIDHRAHIIEPQRIETIVICHDDICRYLAVSHICVSNPRNGKPS